MRAAQRCVAEGISYKKALEIETMHLKLNTIKGDPGVQSSSGSKARGCAGVLTEVREVCGVTRAPERDAPCKRARNSIEEGTQIVCLSFLTHCVLGF